MRGTGLRVRINHAIFSKQVRVIDQEGVQLGVLDIREAQKKADETGLDLVEIAPSADPPVCRIMDYGKYKFQQNKKQAAARKKQKQIQLKEVKFRPTTDKGDYQVKLRNILRFLEENNKVKITVRFKGREMLHKELGQDVLKRLQGDLAERILLEQAPKSEGRLLVMVVAPAKKK
ncbi:MAG: translation initiation factor IF-3 [Gammaproteobacteria bacterium]|nr:translation initiation factor IF-3 [Gammaproteobacteria bacterium]